LDSKVAAAFIAVIAILAAGAAVAANLRGPGGSRSPAPSAASTATSSPAGPRLELPLHEGDVLVYNVTASFTAYVNGTANTTVRSYTQNLTVVGFYSDYLLSVRLGGNETGNLPYGTVAMPPSQLGSGEVSLPILVPPPIGGVCLTLRLEGSGGGLYTYTGGATLPGYNLTVEAAYNASSGLLEHTRIRLDAFWANYTAEFELRLLGYTPNASAPMLEETLPEGAFCGNLSSSDLRLLGDGFYVIRNGRPVQVGPGEAEEALSGPAVVVVLNKYCPHCQRFWPELLRGSGSVSAPVYLVVFSGNTGFANPAIADYVNTLLEKVGQRPGSIGTPAVFVFPGKGGQPAYRTGEMSARAFATFANAVLGH
jgi:hypothetical protein